MRVRLLRLLTLVLLLQSCAKDESVPLCLEASFVLQSLGTCLERQKLNTGRFPSKLGDGSCTPVNDPWQRPFFYKPLESTYVLYSYGPDGLPDTDDDVGRVPHSNCRDSRGCGAFIADFTDLLTW